MQYSGISTKKYGAWAIVTGASDGIGKAFAIELAAKGFSLVLAARRLELLEQLGKDLSTKYGIEYQALSLDFSLPTATESLVAQTAGLDIGLVVAAAGFGTSGRFIDVSVTEELSMLDVNCRAVISLTHHFGNIFRNQKRGGIILLSSLVAFQGAPRAANYAATKAFIQTFAEGLSLEMKPFGVDILSVAPGPVNSGFGSRANMKIGGGAAKPDVIARGALAALGKRTTVRPGFISKFLGYSISAAPRFIRVMIMTAIMGSMTKHQK
jgi:short-subunit dehydrogenase